MADPVLALAGLRFAWPGSNHDCLDIETLQVHAGQTLFLHGPSGCGKSTLLSLMAGVLQPRAGRITLLGQDWAALRPGQRDRHRVDHVGYIFQQFNLLPYLDVLHNTLAPCRFSARRADAAVARAGSLAAAAGYWLGAMGLDAADWSRPAGALSVGQQQRVAAARALIGDPALVIADEPTSALDEQRRDGFLDLLLASCRDNGSALVFVSHDRRLAARFDQTLLLPTLNRARPAGQEAR